MSRLPFLPLLKPAQKLFLVATLPLLLAVAAITALVAEQSRALAEAEIRSLETQLIEAKKAELRNYVTQARNGFYFVYGNAAPDDDAAREQVKQILAAMIYGADGSFFVYDWDGVNLVNPRHTEMINQDMSGLTDIEGTPITDELIRIARQGSGYHSYLWTKPSTGETAQMISYVTGFANWRWAVGTGVFIDDILASVAAARAQVEARIQRTFLSIGLITLLALLMVFAAGLLLNMRERRLADAKQKTLTQRVFDAQEEERGRVARELHDGISQMLIGVRYALDISARRRARNDARADESLGRAADTLSEAIREVRRISRDLRPAILDDLGLGPALKALCEDFGDRTGIETTFKTAVFRNRLDAEAKIALYRVAQEALANIERHSGAARVEVEARGHRTAVVLRIADDGRGFVRADGSRRGGLGLRNMQERIEQLDGTLTLRTGPNGTEIEARVPLSHMLAPGGGGGDTGAASGTGPASGRPPATLPDIEAAE